jgi:hypothetical protein
MAVHPAWAVWIIDLFRRPDWGYGWKCMKGVAVIRHSFFMPGLEQTGSGSDMFFIALVFQERQRE